MTKSYSPNIYGGHRTMNTYLRLKDQYLNMKFRTPKTPEYNFWVIKIPLKDVNSYT